MAASSPLCPTQFLLSLHKLDRPFSSLKTPNSLFPNPRISSSNCRVYARILSGSSSFRAKASMAEVKSQKRTGNLNIFDAEEKLSVSLAEHTANLSAKFTKERGAFTVVFSGNFWSHNTQIQSIGQDSMCSGLMRELFPRITQIVTISLLMTTSCLRYLSFLALYMPLMMHFRLKAADDYETYLKQLVKNGVMVTSEASGFPKFDLMLLGMGPDGHVASLFPGHPLLKEDKKWVTFIKESPKPAPERITFTFPVINSSSYAALVVCGGGKTGAVKMALRGNQTSDLLPVHMVSPEGELKWFLDKEATSRL